MKTKITLLFSFFCLPVILAAQDLYCGTITPPKFDTTYVLPHYKAPECSKDDNNTRYFAIQFHIIRHSNGLGGLEQIDNHFKETLLDELNTYYKNANIVFYSCTNTNYINSDTYYEFKSDYKDELVDAYNNNDCINIYYTNSVNSWNGKVYQSVCGYAYYPPSSTLYTNKYNFIVISNDCYIHSTVHEMGHFFNLYHTHEGNGKELVNGSNCTKEGDLCCDTPADPGLSAKNVTRDCKYIGSTVDANGDKYSPDPTNIMSYSLKHCRNHLTGEQYQRVRNASFLATRKKFIHATWVENKNIILNKTYADDNVILKNVTIKNANVSISACNEAILESNVNIPIGSTLTIY